MAFPTETYLQFVRNSMQWVAQEFESFYAQVEGYLRAEHKDDGSHGDVTADSLEVDRIEVHTDPTDSTTGAVAFKQSAGTGIALSSDGGAVVISNESVTGARTPIISIGSVDPGAGVSAGTGIYYHATNGDNITSIIGQDGYADYIGWFNDRFGSDAMMKLYKSTGPVARLCPPTGTSSTHTLGSPDGSSLRWDGLYIDRATIYEGGDSVARANFTDIAYNSGDFTGSGTITWTVASGDLSVFRYRRSANTVRYEITIRTSSVSGTGTTLNIALDHTAAAKADTTCDVLDNLVEKRGYLAVAASASTATITLASGANWSASTDQTFIFAAFDVPV